MDFKQRRRRRSYRERLREIADLVNRHGTVTVADLVRRWELEPTYIRRLVGMALMKYPYMQFDAETDELFIPERREGAVKPETEGS